MKKLFLILLVVSLSLPAYSCRETVPPETLEDTEGTGEESSKEEVDLGRYDDQDSEENR